MTERRADQPEVDQEHTEDRKSDLIDISALNKRTAMKQLREMPVDAFARSLRRILAELDGTIEPVAGFQSGI